ncbi:MAG: ATP-binding protein, partial [Chlorobiales bacterium]|nr:ATP-binding protein [Chlorobiales bacterium]
KKTIQISDVPEDYIKVRSGLGETSPNHIIAIPLLLDQKLVGVIELAKLEPFSKEQVELLELVPKNISIAITSMQARTRTRELLTKTQEQAEELQAQQEELRVTNEELEEQARILRESEERLRDQSEELRVANEELKDQSIALEEQRDAIRVKNDHLRRAQKDIERKAWDLEQASKYKSEFLANMSHELRTPLNSIIMLSQILLGEKKGELTEEQQELIRTVHSSGADLHKLINEILDLSKVEAGKMVLSLEEVSLESVSSTLEKSFSHIAEEKGLHFSIRLDDMLPASIFSDTQKLQQVLKNLISNAIKFTESGNVEVSINRFSGKTTNPSLTQSDDGLIAFSVKDTGIGIPEDKLSIIFEAFLQVDGTTSRRFGGTGLGLSISRELTRLLGGEIQVTSIPDEGSEFVLILPERFEPKDKTEEQGVEAISDQPATVEPVAVAKSPSKSELVKDDRAIIAKEDKTLLIIEDDDNFSKVLLDLAIQRGYKALVASDGETGLHFADYYHPSAIVLDIGLPNIDGIEVLNRLKENS